MTRFIARTWTRFALLLACIFLTTVEPAIGDWLMLAPGSFAESILAAALTSLVLLAAALLVIRLLHTLVWEGGGRRTDVAVPRLLTDLVDGAIIVVTLTLIFAFVFDLPMNGLIATSGVAVAVIGFALKSMISDLFSGIAITVERPFRLGDWIEIQNGPVGRVRSMSWRATGLELENGLHMIVPNSQLSEMVLRIYDRPDGRRWRDEFEITLGYDISEQQADRVLIAAATEVPGVDEVDTRIVRFDDRGVVWRLRYWIPDYPNSGLQRNAIRRNVLRNLHYAGLAVPVPRLYAQTDAVAPVYDGDTATATFLRRVPLFTMLTADELGALARAALFRLVPAGGTVVRAGERGDSLFLVKEGLMAVLIDRPSGEETTVARLHSGQFFGEMSLLTGAPRAATVRAAVEGSVIEITRDAIAPILARRNELLEAMSAVLADRELQNRQAGEATVTPAEAIEEQQTLAHQILGRMRAFFRIGGAAAA